MTEPRSTVFIVDDDEAIRSGLSLLLRSYSYQPESFPSGQAFLARCEQAMPQRFMAIFDLSMPGMDGLRLQDELQRRSIDVPIVFLSGGGDIPAAVEAVRHGAIDFVEKPVDSAILIDRIEKALNLQESRNTHAAAQNGFQVRLESLTPREREVLESIADGKTSKATASSLGISERTIELHRSRILKKMGTRNSAELLNLVIPNLRPRKDPGK